MSRLSISSQDRMEIYFLSNNLDKLLFAVMCHLFCIFLFYYYFFCLGDMRNDLYITLEKGEFEKGGKTVARNVEITGYALDADGQILRVFRFTQALINHLYINASVQAVL